MYNWENKELKDIIDTKNWEKLKSYLHDASSPLSVLGIYNYLKPPQLSNSQRRYRNFNGFSTIFYVIFLAFKSFILKCTLNKWKGASNSINPPKSTLGYQNIYSPKWQILPSRQKAAQYTLKSHKIRKYANQSALSCYNKFDLRT